jgi:uncharacterized membrane protein
MEGKFVKRFPFLDWMRGLAIVLMIQCHTFNSFTRLDLRGSSAYVLSQFVGGMAAPLFLFMAGMTLAFQMESLDRREASGRRRFLVSLRRAGYVLAVAFAFRISNWIASLPRADAHEIIKVDILNCMGVALAAFSTAALFQGLGRVRFAAALSLVVAGAAPVLANLPWNGVPLLLREYLVPVPGLGHFPFFPCASYVGFGVATGCLVKRAADERMDRLMQWSVLGAFALVFCGQYFSNIPYSIYARSNFWTDSPALIVIRVGIALLMMAGSYIWTQYGAGLGWSWMQTLGKNSLMVYWVHVMLVYGDILKPLKRALPVGMAGAATVIVTLAMIGLSAGWLTWKMRRAQRWKAATTPAAGSAQPA